VKRSRRRSRQEAYDERTGRHDPKETARRPSPSGDAAAAAYVLLLPKLAGLRSRLVSDSLAARPIDEMRRDHADLDHTLADAVAAAFAADAGGAAAPAGTESWVAAGLARSRERELALLAATDVCGALRVALVPSPRWALDTGTDAVEMGDFRP
jgi:hypothetical protein